MSQPVHVKTNLVNEWARKITRMGKIHVQRLHSVKYF